MDNGSRAPAAYVALQVAIWVILLPIVILTRRDPEAGGIWRSFSVVMVGGIVLVTGVVMVYGAARQLADAGQPVFGMRPRSRLVTDGWYALVRNPQDVGTLLLSMAAPLAIDMRAMWSLPVIALVYYVIGVELLEDFYLFHRFGDEFEEYRRRVHRWIPRLWRTAG